MLLTCAPFSLNAADVIASGTGFAVSPGGHILTNAHVVSGCINVTARIGGVELQAQVVSIDSQNDLALLKISGTFTTVLPLREGTRVQLGETVAAFGYPLQGVISTSLNMTTGNISALAGLGDDARSLQFTAPIQPGSSGGPLVDASGNVVGVVTSKLSPLWAAKNIGDVPQNVNFALKASVIRDFLESRSVEYHSGGLTATTAVTELPGKVSGAIFPLQRIGTPETKDIKASTVSRAETPIVEKRPGVLLAGYGSPAESFQFVFLELENTMTADGIQIANKPSAMQQVNGDSVSIQNLLNIAQRQGSDSLLYLTVEHGSTPTGHSAQLQCFDVATGKLLWTEKVSSIGHWASTNQAAAKAVAEQLKKKIKEHAGKPGLPLR
jgi:hypothetical protein